MPTVSLASTLEDASRLRPRPRIASKRLTALSGPSAEAARMFRLASTRKYAASGLVALPAAVSLSAGLLKLRYHREFRAAVVSWRVVPGEAVIPFARTFPLVEVSAGAIGLLSLVLAPLRYAGALCMVVLYASFSVGQLAIRSRAPAADCGCAPNASQRIGGKTLARSGVLGFLAALGLILH